MSKNDTKVVKIKKPVYDKARDERDERGLGSLNAVIESWRKDAERFRDADITFKDEIQTRGRDE